MQFPYTVVINCAGIGSRLGLGQTKTLIEILGKPIIHWQLEMLSAVKDIRIVVGYQACTLMNIVNQLRKDILFIYNHNYFTTKTAYSLYLGSRHGSELILSLDGDTLFHPKDIQKFLTYNEEFISYSPIMSQEPVYVSLKDNIIQDFSLVKGDYEWAGPALLSQDKLSADKTHNVYEVIEKHLPIKGNFIRALDIDTLADYRNAVNVFSQWIK